MLNALRWAALVSAIVLFVVACGIVYYSSQSPTMPEQQQATDNNRQKPSESQNPKLLWDTIFPDTISFFTFWLGLFTGALALVAFLQLSSLNRAESIAATTAKAAKDSADVANRTLIASQRAWVRTEVSIGDQPITFGENGAGTTISFKITNVGNAPAINISHYAWLLVPKNGGPSPFEEQRKRCGEIRNQPFRLGFTLFPGEIFPSSIGKRTWGLGVHVSKDDVDKGREISADGKHVLLWVIGCVDYTFPTDPTAHHQTMFAFELSKRNWSPIGTDEGPIPASELILQESVLGDGRYAD